MTILVDVGSLERGEKRPGLKTGALCCIVASRPLVTTKSPPRSYSLSQDHDLQWRMNLSYSPNTRDGLDQDMSDESPGPSSTSRSRKSLEFCFQQSPRWDLSASEQKPCTVNSIPISNSSKHQSLNEDKCFDRASTAISPSSRSVLSLSEQTAPSETPSKQPSSFTHCSYPQVFCNPVSDHPREEDSDSSFMISTRNHQDSPAEEASSPRNPSSNDMMLHIDMSNETEEVNPRLEPASTTHQRCGVCKKLLSQRSPWSSYKIMRCRDMPVAGVFPCHHVYHVECLDKVTPTAQTRDPLCPICSNNIGDMEQPLVMPETLQLTLRSLRRSRTAAESETLNSDNQRRHIRRRRSHKWEKLSCCLNIISFSSSSHNPT